MADPIVIIDNSAIREGRLEDVKKAMSGLVEFAKANEPRMLAYTVYLTADGTRVTVLQVHPDSASAEYHLQAAGPAFSRFAECIRMESIDVYGRPSPVLLERLQRKARQLGGGKVTVHAIHAGFARFQLQAPGAVVTPGAAAPPEHEGGRISWLGDAGD